MDDKTPTGVMENPRQSEVIKVEIWFKIDQTAATYTIKRKHLHIGDTYVSITGDADDDQEGLQYFWPWHQIVRVLVTEVPND